MGRRGRELDGGLAAGGERTGDGGESRRRESEKTTSGWPVVRRDGGTSKPKGAFPRAVSTHDSAFHF